MAAEKIMTAYTSSNDFFDPDIKYEPPLIFQKHNKYPSLTTAHCFYCDLSTAQTTLGTQNKPGQ
jgi:hypothetical protein